jgi:hypothetical protein
MPGMPTKPRKDAPKSDRSARRFPFTVELKEPDYLVLLKHARGTDREGRRLRVHRLRDGRPRTPRPGRRARAEGAAGHRCSSEAGPRGLVRPSH